MVEDISSFEGKLVIIRFTEADYDNEGDAVLLYRVISGCAQPIYGVMDLPDGVLHNLYYEQVDVIVKRILDLGETEVFSLWIGIAHVSFFGQTLGYFDITDDGECWGELHDISFGYAQRFVDAGIRVQYIHPETYKIME